MRLVVLYRPQSEHGRVVEDFIRDLQSRYIFNHLEIMDIDSRDGTATASLYDIMQYPAILVLQNDGLLQKSWEGGSMPLMDEVAAYATL